MNLKKRILTVLLAMALVVTSLGIAAFAASDDEIRPRRIDLSDNDRTFDVDDTYGLDYEILPDDANVDLDDIIWRSSNDDIVSVDSYGTITCHEPGTATITARTKKYGAKGSITITVKGSRSSYDYGSYYYEYDEDGNRYRVYYDGYSSRSSSTVRDDATESSRTSTANQAAANANRDIKLTETASRETVVQAVQNASGGSAGLDNYAAVSVDTLKAAANAGDATINFDTRTSGGALVGRLKLNPAAAKDLSSGTIKLGVYYNDAKTTSLQSTYNSRYTNQVHVVKCDQTSFGMTARIYVRIGKNVNASDLVFYSYDANNNTHSKLSVQNVKVDSNGYVSFDTTRGGTILISEGGELSSS